MVYYHIEVILSQFQLIHYWRKLDQSSLTIINLYYWYRRGDYFLSFDALIQLFDILWVVDTLLKNLITHHL